jgi:sterol desaturase/sphingolipid hydroxylase (fatty acid hydroxylase superfamily)
MHAGSNIENGLLILVFGALLALLLAERLRPFRKFLTGELKRSAWTNASAFVFNNLVMNLLSVSSLLVVAEKFSGYGLLANLRNGPIKWAICFVLLDFAVYGWHFLGHKSESLWRFHKIHHTDKTLHVTTGLRFHVFDQLIETIVKCGCTAIFGVEAHVVLVCELVRMLFVLFHHANISIPGEKWLSYVIITPSLHRAHHSTLRSEHDSNYGIVLSIWDTLFGTRKELIPAQIGLPVVEAENFVQLFSLAFLTEQHFASLLHLLPRHQAVRLKRRDASLAEG